MSIGLIWMLCLKDFDDSLSFPCIIIRLKDTAISALSVKNLTAWRSFPSKTNCEKFNIASSSSIFDIDFGSFLSQSSASRMSCSNKLSRHICIRLFKSLLISGDFRMFCLSVILTFQTWIPSQMYF